MRRRRLLLCLCSAFLCGVAVVFAEPKCTRGWDKDEKSPFLCGLEVIVRREEDCGLYIQELFLFPSTVERAAFRGIPRLSGFQVVSDVVIERDGRRLGIMVDPEPEGIENQLKVEFPMEDSQEPVLYNISYRLKDGVMKFQRKCPMLEGDPDNEDNIFRWRRMSVEESIDVLNVTFISPSGKLTALGNGKRVSDNQVQFDELNLNQDKEFYVREEGLPICPRKLHCFEGDPMVKFWVPILIVAAIVVSIIVVVVMVIWYRTRAKQKRAGTLP